MKYLQLLVLSLLLIGCNEKTETPAKPSDSASTENKIENPSVKVNDKADLVEIKGTLFTEYYPGKKAIKFQGRQDAEKKRHGQWIQYSVSGVEISSSFYTHGVLDGYSIVKRPDGSLYYHGSYSKGKKIGPWKTYDEKGVVVSENDFGPAE